MAARHRTLTWPFPVVAQVTIPYLDYFVLDGGIASCLSRHELLAFYRVAIDRERYRRRLNSPVALPEEPASGAVRVHHVKSPTVHVDRATDRDVVDVVAPGSPLRKNPPTSSSGIGPGYRRCKGGAPSSLDGVKRGAWNSARVAGRPRRLFCEPNYFSARRTAWGGVIIGKAQHNKL